jgi:hypothetical protein
VIAIGLGMLDLAVLIAKSVPAPPAATSAAGHEHAGLLSLPSRLADSHS